MGSIHKKPNSPYWQAVYIDSSGKQKWKSTKEKDKDKALIKLGMFLNEEGLGGTQEYYEKMIDDFLETDNKITEIESTKKLEMRNLNRKIEEDTKRKIENIEFDYLKYIIFNEFVNYKKLNTCKSYYYSIKFLSKYTKINCITDINEDVMKEFKRNALNNGVSFNNLIVKFRCINGLLKTLYSYGYIKRKHSVYDPLLKNTPHKSNPRMTDHEFYTIINQSKNTRLYNLFILGGFFGLRFIEAMNARYEWFEKSNDGSLYFKVQNNKYDEENYISKFETKSNKDRNIPVYNETLNYFDVDKSEGYIVKYLRKNCANQSYYTSITYDLRVFLKKLYHNKQIRKIYSYHDFRRYFLTRMYIKTKDIIYVKKLAGHVDVQTTQVYIKLDELDIKSNNYQF